MDQSSLSRRTLLSAGAGAVLLPALRTEAQVTPPGTEIWRGLRVGVASYTFRKQPVDVCIAGINRVGLKYVSIKDFHLPMSSTAEQRQAVAKQFRDAGINTLSCGVISTKNDEGNIRAAFQYAKDAGIPTIVGSPDPDSLPIVERMVKEFGIRMAIHNHGPEDKRFPSPYDVWKAVESLDPRVGLCIDVGHTARAGVDPAEAIRKCRERLFDVHMKDLAEPGPKSGVVEVGRGVLDTRAILQALLDIRFQYHVGFEYEKDADDPLPGLAESVGYCRGVMASLRSR
jgi:inosose dehydratase